MAEVYRRFGEVEAAKGSAVYGRIATALSESEEARQVLEGAPARSRHPSAVLAALHYLALSGQGPELTALGAGLAPSGGPTGLEELGTAAVEVVRRIGGEVLRAAAGRKVLKDEDGRHALVYPLVAEAARRAGAEAVGLIDVGRPAGLNLAVDRTCIEYGNGQSLGDPESAVRVSASVVGESGLPPTPIPPVVARALVAGEPVDVTDPDQARWVQACVPPDQAERVARIGAEVGAVRDTPPVLVGGGIVDGVPEALEAVPDDVLPVVITTWVLSSLDVEGRARFLQRLDEAATRRPVAWVSVEGVGVAPGVPTFGDRKASGHSILGVSIFRHGSLHATSVGRTWLRGQMLSWLANQ